jgi:Domain of unknown function (DUF4386)
MENQMQATLQGRNGPDSYRTTARIVGALFLAGMIVYVTGNVLTQSILTAPDHLSAVSGNSMLLAMGAMLMLMASVGDAAHGVLMFPVLKQHNERIAFGYFAARLVDAVLIAVGIVLLLLQIPLGREYLAAGAADSSYLQALSTLSEQAHLYAYEIGMIAVGFAGLMLCYVFYKANLVPRGIGIWGLVGYAFLLSGSALQVLGFDLRLVHTVPGGLWELFIGVWLITKGFSHKPSAPVPAATGIRIAPSPI